MTCSLLQAERVEGKPSHPLPCAQEELGTPVLAFIRSICAVFSLDASVSDQVTEEGLAGMAWQQRQDVATTPLPSPLLQDERTQHTAAS